MDELNGKIILLGAGRPHLGIEHSALHSTLGGTRVLDWLLHLSKASRLTPIFVAGYQHETIQSCYPSLEIISNDKWRETQSAYSFFQGLLRVGADDVLVSYTDVIYREEALMFIRDAQEDIVIAIDSSWKTRFVGRSEADQAASEKVCVYQDRVMRLGSDISVDQADAEFIGLVKFSRKVIQHLQCHSDVYFKQSTHITLSELIEMLRVKGFNVGFFDVKGDWAELNQPEDLARFILGTKAQTLKRLQSMVKLSRIEDQVSFTLSDWLTDAKGVVDAIQKRFEQGTLVVRSSAITEDGFSESNAGAYTSLLNVRIDHSALQEAIETVIGSYPDRNPDNQVLIQPMLQQVKASGVVFTRILNTSAPYYCVNYDDTSGCTESITSGHAKEHKTLLIRRDLPDENLNIPSNLTSLLPALRELESLLGYSSLDIEFAITDQGLHILQVRPIAVKKQAEFEETIFYQEIERAKQTFQHRQCPSPFVANSKAVFGMMPDWNPAEIIGTKPTLLATSLYKYLIMDETWAKQRAEYGYQDVRPHGLLVSFAGHPYVDIRASFSSFVPASLSSVLRDKLVTFYIHWLEQHPYLHDKVEFDVVPTCYAFDFDLWQQRLTSHTQLTLDEIKQLEHGLKAITRHAFNRVEKDLADIEKLDERFHFIVSSKLTPLNKAAALLSDARCYGTLPFAHLARSAFIAVTLLKSALNKGLIAQDGYENFMMSIRTVSHQLGDDARAVKDGILDWKAFVETYAHLRPGTYDITSESYGANPDYYLRPLVTSSQTDQHNTHNLSGQALMFGTLSQALVEADINIDGSSLEQFLRGAIEGREYAKFMFSRNLSVALDYMTQWGKVNHFKVEQLSHLTLTNILEYIEQPRLDDVQVNYLKSLAEQGRAYHTLVKAIELPPLLCKEEDFDAFLYPSNQANFVGSKKVMAECLDISETESRGVDFDMSGLIVMIPQADPGYDWLFGREIAGLITMYGGANSHMAIRAAEFGLPAAIGVGEVQYRALSLGEVVELNPLTRQVKVIR